MCSIMLKEIFPQPQPTTEPGPEGGHSLAKALIASVEHPGGMEGAIESLQNIKENAAEAVQVGSQPGILPSIVGASMLIHGSAKELSKFGTPEARSELSSNVRERLGNKAGEKLLGLQGQQFPRIVGAMAVEKVSKSD